MGICSVINLSVYNNRDNTNTLVLANNGDAITDLSGVTRVTVRLDNMTTIDSAVAGSSVIWWTDQVTWRGTVTDVLKFKLGHQSITSGEYESVKVTVYDGNLNNGAQIESNIHLTVYQYTESCSYWWPLSMYFSCN